MMDHLSVEELFCELIDLPVNERAAALEAFGLDDGPLRSELIRLLKDAEAADAYFTGTAVAVKMLPHHSISFSPVEVEGDMVGPYRLVRKLGTGGFGVVWQADQVKPLRRTVALKILKAGMDSAEVLARFDAEKQALARMDHLHIAKVLDAGMTDYGRSYFAMELVEGCPVTQFCEENALSTRERLKLFMDVCAAVNHAHQKGVIHRDLKPSNVLVSYQDSEPVVKVIDFGIAKAIEGDLTDQTLLTRAEQWIGTPIYMSPEQMGMGSVDLDTRSDIYALGVILYELITGCPPFDSETLMRAGYEEMRRIIREVDPPRPSARITTRQDNPQGQPVKIDNATGHALRSIKSELDWIVMKAIEKSKDRRYDSAAALADDLGRFLADEPISAKPPSSSYLMAKFARRHRLWIHIASAFLVLIVGAVLLSVWLALRASDAEQIAQERLAAALKDRNAKNQALEEAESVSRLFADVLQRPQPGADGRSVTVMQALDTAVKKLDSQLETQPQRRAALRGVLADTYERLGIFDGSLKLREQNYETFRNTSGASHLSTRMALRKVVEAAEAKGDGQTGLKYALVENELLREANAAPREMEASMRSVVRGWFGVGDRKKATEQQRALVDYCTRMFGENSQQEVKAKWELRQYEASMPTTSPPQGGSNPSAEEETNQLATEIIARERFYASVMERYGSMHAETIDARIKLASALLRAGHTIEGHMHLQALQSITMQMFGPQDDRTLRVQENLVYVYVKLSRMVDAVRIQQAVVNTRRERDGGAAASTMQAEGELERRLFYSGLGEEHGAYCGDLLERRIKIFGKDHEIVIMMQMGFDSNKPEESIKNMQKGIRLMREKHGDHDRGTAELTAALARAYLSSDRGAEAIRYYEECAPDMLDDTWLNFECATMQLWTGNLEGYRVTRRNILGYWERRIRLQQSSPDMFDRALWLGSIADLDDDRQKDIMKRLLHHVESIREGLHVEAEDRHSKPLQKQIKGAVLYRFGMYEQAHTLFEEAARLMNSGRSDSSAFDYQHPKEWVYFLMAMTEQRLGNPDEAKRLFKFGESRLPGSLPSKKNPVLGPYYTGGELLTQWILHEEAKSLIFGK